MVDAEATKALIRTAFADVEYPGDWCLRGSNEGEEPYLLEREFAGKTDWRTLDPEFLDAAPDGYSSALSFFSDEAFRFYLPAYLIADIDEALHECDPVSHLCYGLADEDRQGLVNPRRYGVRTRFSEASYRFSTLSAQQASAVAAYLRLMLERETSDRDRCRIEQALRNYWLPRTEDAPGETS